MKKYNLITPEGTRDLLFDESVARRLLQEKLNALFISYGYSEVITPTIEFYDVFSSTVRHFSQESMYKLSDCKGRLLVIRPDSTLPIARLVATRLKEQPLPLKLFYNQNIFRANPKDSGRDDEISQSGIELIGGDEKSSDFETVAIALDVLENLDRDGYRFEIGNIKICKLLLESLGADEDTNAEIRVCIGTKNYPELDKLLSVFPKSDTTEALRMLPRLFGACEVFDMAAKYFKTPELISCLMKTKALHSEICNNKKYCDRIYVDFGMITKFDFYSGMLFRGLLEGHGAPVLSGGRYDGLLSDFGANIPATGFAVNNNAAVDAYLSGNDMKKNAETFVFIEDENLARGMKCVKNMIESGERVCSIPVKTRDEAISYATAKSAKKLVIIKENGTETIINN